VTRDLDRLTARTFDVLVVGGGIYGLTIAYDAAQRGLAVALIERDDFGSGASFNHLRTIHGGLRYLQTLDLRRARESLRERRTIARIAPHAVRPLAFVLPLTRSIMRGRAAMRLGFALDRLVAFDRNRGVQPALRLPGGRVLSHGAAVERFPALRRQAFAGAAVWHDYVLLEADRLTFSFVIAATELGVALANHVEGTALVVDRRRVTGVRAIDNEGGREIEIAARLVVNATGSAVDRLLAPLGVKTTTPMLKAMNLVTRRPAAAEAFGGRAPSGRNLFMIPWRGRALFGTWESPRACDPANARVLDADVVSFIGEINAAFPGVELTRADVTLVHRGVVPARLRGEQGVVLEGDEQIRDHASEGIDGLLSVAGTKYTTARAVAERIVDTLLRKLAHAPVPCRTATTPLPGGDIADIGRTTADAQIDDELGLPNGTIPHLVGAYGSRYPRVLELAAGRFDWQTRLAESLPVIGAELVWAARNEMSVTLADAVLRRTPLGALGFPGDAAVNRAADLVGEELSWPDERKNGEIAALQRFYAEVR
jgi:glycerol-3-phosphate dehydrogenase